MVQEKGNRWTNRPSNHFQIHMYKNRNQQWSIHAPSNMISQNQEGLLQNIEYGKLKKRFPRGNYKLSNKNMNYLFHRITTYLYYTKNENFKFHLDSVKFFPIYKLKLRDANLYNACQSDASCCYRPRWHRLAWKKMHTTPLIMLNILSYLLSDW